MTRETALQRVQLAGRDIEGYAGTADHDAIEELRELARGLRGLRLCR